MQYNLKYRFILFIFIVIFTHSIAFAQRDTLDKYSDIEKTYNNSYYIKDISYNITGLITEAGLILKLPLRKDSVFASRKEFLEYIRNKRIELRNIRQLKFTSTILFDITWNEQEKRFDAVITIYAIAGWTILALPYFKYSDNSGLLLSARGRDYNFLGSLETLRIDFNYTLVDTLAEYGLSTSFKYPLKIDEHILTTGIEETISWANDNFFENKTKLTFDYTYPIFTNSSFLAGVDQEFISKGGNSNQPTIYSYANSDFFLGLDIPLNTTVLPIVNVFRYVPKIKLNRKYPLNKLTPENNNAYNDTFFIFEHNFLFGRIDLKQNFRQGIKVSLGNEVEYQKSYNGFNINIDIEATGHLVLYSIMGISTRAYFIQNFYHRPEHEGTLPGTGYQLAIRLRGVLDDKFGKAVTGMAFNFDVLFSLFSLQPLLIDEVQLGVFSDIALRKKYNTSFDPEHDLKVTAGIQLIIFSIFRSVYLRASLGSDILQAIKEGMSFSSLLKNRELFIGLNLFY